MTAPLLEATLRDRPPAPAWLAALRRDAEARVRAHGLPTQRNEAWRFTPVGAITALELPRAGDGVKKTNSSSSAETCFFDSVPPAWVEAYVGRLARSAFAELNMAAVVDGVAVRARRGERVDGAVRISHDGGPGVAHPRVLIVADEGSELTVVESYRGGGQDQLTNAVTEVVVGDGARVTHVRVHDLGASRATAAVAVRCGRDASYRSIVVTLGGALVRLDLDVALAEVGASCALDGVYLAGAGEHVDHHTVIDHRAPHGTSRERYRGVLTGPGTAVFDGTVIVRPGAQRTSAHQENRNLALAPDAVVHTKPHLEIEADDVSCSHGATVGGLDPDQLYYLRARGLADGTARAMLAFAFARELLDDIADPSLLRAVAARLPGGASLEDLP